MAAASHILKNVLTVTLLKGLGLLLTLVLVALQAAAFGTSIAADAFYFGRQLLSSATSMIENWLKRVMIPVFAADLAADPVQARARLIGICLRVGAISVASALGLVALAPVVVDLLAPGFSGVQRSMAVDILRILSIGLPLSVVAALFASLQFTRRRFGIATVATLMPRVAALAAFGIVGLGLSVIGLAWWIVAGMAVMMAMTVWVTLRAFDRAAKSAGDAQLPASMHGERRIAVAVFFLGQIALGWSNTILASLGAAGTMALMFIGLRLVNAGPGMTNTAVATVYYTEYAHAALDQRQRQAIQIAAGFRLSMFFAIPVGAILLAIGGPIVTLLLQRGAFTAADTAALVPFIQLMVPSLIINAFYANASAVVMADARLPAMRLSIIAVAGALAVRLVSGWVLVPALGINGLALAIMSSTAVLAGVLWISLTRHYGPVLTWRDVRPVLMMAVAAAIAAAIPLLWPWNDVIVPGVLFGFAYLAIVWLMGLPEAGIVLKARGSRRRGRDGDTG